MSQTVSTPMTFGGSDNTFGTLFEHSLDAMLMLDSSALFVDCNPAASRLMKSERSSLLNQPLASLSPERQPDGQLSSEKAAQMVQTAFEKGSSLFEWVYCRPNGEDFYAEVSLTAVPYQDRRALLAMCHDITHHKKAETDLQEAEGHFRSLFDSYQDSVFIIQDGRIQIVNVKLRGMTGYSAEEFAGMSFTKLVAPEDQPQVADYYRRRQAGEAVPEEYGIHLLKKDGETRIPVNVKATIINYRGRTATMGTVRNISEQLNMQTELQESEQRYRALFDSLQDGIFVAQDNALQVTNATVEEMLGFQTGELYGAPFAKVIAPEHQALIAENYRKRVAGEPLSEGYFVNLLHKDGQTRVPVDLRVVLINYRGRPATMGTVRNISEKMRMEAELQDMVARRGSQVQLSTEIAQEIAAAPQLDDLFNRVVTLIKERLNYYHTQLLHYEPAFNAVVLVKGYGEVGEKMLAAGHRMEMGRGLIGMAAATGQTIMRPDLTNDPDWHPNALLLDTRGEIAVPIKYGDRILGVLDVQSDRASGLTDDDRLLLEGLCGQVAIAMEGTRLRQQMQERLNELNSLYGQNAREGWKAYRGTGKLTTGYLFDRITVQPAAEVWADEIEKAVTQKDLVPAAAPDGASVAPLAVHGEVIGALGIYDDPRHQLTEDDLSLIEQVSEQVALALESARLFEQTSTALNEAERLYSFSRKLAEAKDLDAVVEVVVEAAAIPEVNRGVLITLEYGAAGQLTGGVVKAGWYSGKGHPIEPPLGTHYDQRFAEATIKRYQVSEPLFFSVTNPDAQGRGTASLAVLPLFVGISQIGVLLLETDISHEFTEDEKRPISSLAQQAAITIQGHLLLEQVTSSEARFRDISMSSADWVWEVDAQGRYTFCSERIKDVLGYTVEEMLGKTPFDFMVPEEVNRVGEIFGRVVRNKERIIDLENRNLTKDGRERVMLTSGAPIVDEKGNLLGYRGVDRDITESKQAQETIAKRAVELAMVAEITTRVSTIQSPDEMLQTVVDLTRQVFNLYHVHIYLFNETANTLVISKGSGETGRKMVSEGRQILYNTEKSLVARAARTRQGLIANNTRNEPDFLPHPLLPDTRSEMTVPMIAGDRLLGVLDVQDAQVDRFTPEDVNIMTTLAAQVAVSLQNARSYARAQRQAEREALINTISERIQATSTVENALQVAVREIGRALGAQHTAIRLGLERKTDGS